MRRLALLALIALNGCSPVAPIGASEPAPAFRVEKVRWRRSRPETIWISGDVVNTGTETRSPNVDVVARDSEGAVISMKTVYTVPPLPPGGRHAFTRATEAEVDPTSVEAVAY